MPLESPSAYNMYLFNLRIGNDILLKIFINEDVCQWIDDKMAAVIKLASICYCLAKKHLSEMLLFLLLKINVDDILE